MKKYYQQGDVIIKPITNVPSDCKNRESLILAEGEATGHRHEIVGNAETFQQEENIFLIAYEDITIVHQEHGPINLPSGTFQISIVREYDHFKEEAKKVVD